MVANSAYWRRNFTYLFPGINDSVGYRSQSKAGQGNTIQIEFYPAYGNAPFFWYISMGQCTH